MAWQCRIKPNGDWWEVVSLTPHTDTDYYEYRALFAHPSPPIPLEAAALPVEVGEIAKHITEMTATNAVFTKAELEPLVARLAALTAELEQVKRERDEVREKCGGCITPAECTEALSASEREREKLTAALEEIARQKLGHELTDDEHDSADFVGAYDTLVSTARAALQAEGGGQ